jgi:hypothetical protein
MILWYAGLASFKWTRAGGRSTDGAPPPVESSSGLGWILPSSVCAVQLA